MLTSYVKKNEDITYLFAKLIHLKVKINPGYLPERYIFKILRTFIVLTNSQNNTL